MFVCLDPACKDLTETEPEEHIKEMFDEPSQSEHMKEKKAVMQASPQNENNKGPSNLS